MHVNNYDIFARELPKSARENVQKSARERTPLPVNFFKKCPWTRKSARETCWKNDVHVDFQCSREKKNTENITSLLTIVNKIQLLIWFCADAASAGFSTLCIGAGVGTAGAGADFGTLGAGAGYQHLKCRFTDIGT